MKWAGITGYRTVVGVRLRPHRSAQHWVHFRKSVSVELSNDILGPDLQNILGKIISLAYVFPLEVYLMFILSYKVKIFIDFYMWFIKAILKLTKFVLYICRQILWRNVKLFLRNCIFLIKLILSFT